VNVRTAAGSNSRDRPLSCIRRIRTEPAHPLPRVVSTRRALSIRGRVVAAARGNDALGSTADAADHTTPFESGLLPSGLAPQLRSTAAIRER
jgi:hypothetical protein